MAGKIKRRVGKHGTTWSTLVELPPDPSTGQRRQKRISGPTKRDVEHQVLELRHQIDRGAYVELSRETVREFLNRWLVAREPTLRPASSKRYSDMVRLHIIPRVGDRRLDKLSPLDVQHLYADRLAAGLSPSSVAMLHNILHNALKQAVRWGILAKNVTEMVDPPRESTPDYAVWNSSEASAFLVEADRDTYAALWRLAILTGMRKGEILGLRWEDVDLNSGLVSVRRTLSRGKGGTFEYGPPKTKHGRRSISIPHSVVQTLRSHRARQAEARLRAGAAYIDDGVVFATEDGRPVHPNTLAYRFKALIEASGVKPIRFHDLRHTSATLMLANGEHPKIAQERLGHSDIAITLNLYSHVTMDMQREAADRLDALVGQAKISDVGD